jgi:hypothetical protein
MVAKRRNAVNQICGRRESHTSGITIYFSNRELADRVAKAFQHLLRISGGKDEPILGCKVGLVFGLQALASS